MGSEDMPAFGRVKIARYLAEFLGTMFLILSIRLTASTSIFASFAIGTCLMVCIYQFGWISGAHFNPAVTIAVLVRGNVESFSNRDYPQIIMYLISQLLGGLFGGIFGNIIGGKDVCFAGPKVSNDFDLGQGFLSELIFTFLLTFVVLHTGTHQIGNQFYGLAIGFSLFIAINCIGGITGCAINPSVWFGLNMAGIICDSDSKNDDKVKFDQIWLFWGAQIIAACISGILFRYLFEPAYKKLDEANGPAQVELNAHHVTQQSEA